MSQLAIKNPFTGKRRPRVQEFLRDLDQYKGRVPQDAIDWLLAHYVPELVNRPTPNESDIERKKRERDNKAYYMDMFRAQRVGLPEGTCIGDAVHTLAETKGVPIDGSDERPVKLATKKKGKRKKRGCILSAADWAPPMFSPEDTWIDVLDAGGSFFNLDEQDGSD